MVKPPYPDYFYEGPGVIEGRLWWEQTDVYWDLPFYSEFGLTQPPERDAMLAAREQLFALRELMDEGDLAPMLPERVTADAVEPDI
jgi:hypothetical protein